MLAPALMLVTSREKLHLSCGDTNSLRNKWKRVAGSRDSEWRLAFPAGGWDGKERGSVVAITILFVFKERGLSMLKNLRILPEEKKHSCRSKGRHWEEQGPRGLGREEDPEGSRRKNQPWREGVLPHPLRQEAGRKGRMQISLQMAEERTQEVKEVPVWWLLFSLLRTREVVR